MKLEGRLENSMFFVNNFPGLIWILELCILVIAVIVYRLLSLYGKKYLRCAKLSMYQCGFNIIQLFTNQGEYNQAFLCLHK